MNNLPKTTREIINATQRIITEYVVEEYEELIGVMYRAHVGLVPNNKQYQNFTYLPSQNRIRLINKLPPIVNMVNSWVNADPELVIVNGNEIGLVDDVVKRGSGVSDANL